MEKFEIIRNYAAANSEPDQNFCPILLQDRTKKQTNNNEIIHRYWISNTGEMVERNLCCIPTQIINDPCACYSILKPRGTRGYNALYAKYNEEYQFLELAPLYMYAGAGKEGEPRKWVYCQGSYEIGNCDWRFRDRVFLFKNDPNVYDINGDRLWLDAQGKYYNKTFLKFIRSIHHMIIVEETNDQMQMLYQSKYNSIYWWVEVYKLGAPRPQSKLATQLRTMEGLAPVEEIAKTTTEKRFFFFEMNQDWGVFRYIQLDDSEARKFIEPMRVYISKAGKPTLMLQQGGEWRVSSVDIHSACYKSANAPIINADQISRCQPIKWIKPILDDWKVKPVANIIAILRHPVLEKLAKSGYGNIAKSLLRCGTVKANLRDDFGADEAASGSLQAVFGLNKYQLDWVNKLYEKVELCDTDYYYSVVNCNHSPAFAIALARIIYGDISGFNKETTEQILNPCLSLVSRVSWRNIEHDLFLGAPYNYRSHKPEFTEDQKAWMKKILAHSHQSSEFLEMYVDTVRTYNSLNNDRKPNLENLVEVTDLGEMNRYHDGVVALYTQQREEERARGDAQRKEQLEREQKMFEKTKEERKQRFNRTGEHFLIRVPETLTEIVNEGTMLRHCVGGYTSRHAMGSTTILFLRRVECPNAPFYTIEVQDNQVVQIHGFANKWLGNNPEAIPFVIQWLKMVGARCASRILLEKSVGYGATGHLLDGKQFGL